MKQVIENRAMVGVHIQIPLSVSIELDRLKTDRLEQGKRTSKQQLIVESVKQMLNDSYESKQTEQ